MGQVGRFTHLSPKNQIFLIKVIGLVITIRLGLWLLPFRILRRLLGPISRPNASRSTPGQPAKMRIVWAVKTVSRYVPEATCLTQALAAQTLLLRRGIPAQLQIGVAKDEAGQLAAHAWVESEGQIVIGGAESSRHYIRFPSLEGKNS